MNTVELTIGGMNCNGCAERIHGLLEKEIGIKKVSVSSEEGTGRISYSPRTIDKEKIVAIIERAGFTVTKG